jgi:copper chaperone CopZ
MSADIDDMPASTDIFAAAGVSSGAMASPESWPSGSIALARRRELHVGPLAVVPGQDGGSPVGAAAFHVRRSGRHSPEPLAKSRPSRLTLELAPGANVGSDTKKEHLMKTTVFKIEGMNFDACANTIKTLVEKEPGVQMASVSYSDRQARVLFDPKSIEEDQLVATIQKPGFRVVGREETT